MIPQTGLEALKACLTASGLSFTEKPWDLDPGKNERVVTVVNGSEAVAGVFWFDSDGKLTQITDGWND